MTHFAICGQGFLPHSRIAIGCTNGILSVVTIGPFEYPQIYNVFYVQLTLPTKDGRTKRGLVREERCSELHTDVVGS